MAVTQDKQRKISMVALDYLKKSGQMDEKARFDVVGIDESPDGRRSVEWVRDAF